MIQSELLNTQLNKPQTKHNTDTNEILKHFPAKIDRIGQLLLLAVQRSSVHFSAWT
jgi:hypothetical protein